jgi:hypothetical protein
VKLPDQIPKQLRKLALFLPDFEDGEGAWGRMDALAVIKSLKTTTVSISEVVIFNMAP